MTIDDLYFILFYSGDLLAIGKIRSLETGLIFNNPSAWAIYCKKIINPAKKSGCGWASVKYKGRKMDYFKNVWLKRKAQRDAEVAKNEAAQALTALSAGLARPEERRVRGQHEVHGDAARSRRAHRLTRPCPAGSRDIQGDAKYGMERRLKAAHEGAGCHIAITTAMRPDRMAQHLYRS